jgi:hypothetical protein
VLPAWVRGRPGTAVKLLWPAVNPALAGETLPLYVSPSLRVELTFMQRRAIKARVGLWRWNPYPFSQTHPRSQFLTSLDHTHSHTLMRVTGEVVVRSTKWTSRWRARWRARMAAR